MSQTGGTETATLEASLRQVMPAVCLVKDRHFRQILGRLRELDEPVPASVEGPFWIKTDKLRTLQILPEESLPTTEQALLIHGPDEWLDSGLSDGFVRRYYWRQLFRGRVLQEALANPIPRDALPESAWTEAYFVLEQDDLIRESAPESMIQAVLASVWLDLHFFEPEDRPFTFPAITDLLNVLPTSWKPQEWLEATRVPGASDLNDRVRQDWHAEVESEPIDSMSEQLASLQELEPLEAESRGNWIRSAILNWQRPSGGQRAAKEAISRGLIPPLAKILGWSTVEQHRWSEAIFELLPAASQGFWPRAARCLYDLQKIANDLQGELSVVDPIESLRTLGQRPIVRRLTAARGVVLVRHLRTAEKHLVRAQIDPETRERVERLFEAEIARGEERLRTEITPKIRDVLNVVGLRPTTRIETVAQEKIIAELLDLICTKGYLRFADLRDGIARSQLKLPNLAGPGELLRGDALLQADQRLALELDGVYQRGEAYLRLLQRGTAITFGTPIGRWLSQYVALPFGGAFMTVEFTKYVKYEITKLSGFVLKQFGLGPVRTEDFLGSLGGSAVSAAHHTSVHHAAPFSTLSLLIAVILGIIYLMLLHVPAFRQKVAQLLSLVWSVVRLGLVVWPKAIWSSPPVRFLRHNAVMRWLVAYCSIAFWVSLLLAFGLTLYPGQPELTWRITLAAFLSITAFNLTPTGRKLQTTLSDWFAALWRDLSVNLVQGILTWVVWIFQRVASFIERWLYTVDEWLRFREGQSTGSLWLKGVLAVIWFPLAYLFRFSFYLLIEPQVNPVKHFPVVTVGHKLILPLTPELANLLGSTWLAGGIISGIPGIFGFIAWELKENWRLYAGNRSTVLPKVALGHHGETMRGLLKPGFHSGTIPTLFAKLRKLLRKAHRTGKPQPVGQAVHGLAEIDHALRVFLEREWQRTLEWASIQVEVQPPTIQVQQVLLAIEQHGAWLALAFEHDEGVISARILEDALLQKLKPIEQTALRISVSGVCQMAGAEPPSGYPAVTWASWSAFWEEFRSETPK